MPLVSGARLGPHETLAPLGAGGMGEVYKARDTRLNRLVAIKVLPTELVAAAGKRQRFIEEARAASALNHPNIISIHDIAIDNGRGRDYIVSGVRLRQNEKAERDSPLPPKRITATNIRQQCHSLLLILLGLFGVSPRAQHLLDTDKHAPWKGIPAASALRIRATERYRALVQIRNAAANRRVGWWLKGLM
jgi:hypothetical protein